MICESRTRRSHGPVAAMLMFLAVIALMPGQSASASFLSITPSTSTLQPGQSETISVQLTTTISVLLAATDLAVSFDSTRFSVSNIQLGTLDSAASGFSGTFVQPVAGEVTSSISTGTLGNQLNAGTVGTLETFTLTALSTAPAGNGQIIIQQSYGLTNTAVYDGNTGLAIALTPAPTNSYNNAIDGIVTVGSVVPEPSSLVLMGLGGLITATTLLRKKARLARAR
jgi:hypothetical protein